MMRAKKPRPTLTMLFPLALAGAAAYACADPHGDLEDYEAEAKAQEDRRQKQNSAGTGGAGGDGTGGVGGEGGSGMAKVADLSGTFVFGCATKLFPDIKQAIRFLSTNEMQLTGSAGAGGEGGGAPTGGKLSLTLQALDKMASTAGEVLGAPTSLPEPVEIDQDGAFAFSFAKVEIDGNANPSGTAVRLADMKFRGATVDKDRFCARFGTTIEDPPLGTLNYADTDNTCVGVRVPDGGVLPTLDTGQLNNCKTLMASTPPPP
jgi:hypothetical protein